MAPKPQIINAIQAGLTAFTTAFRTSFVGVKDEQTFTSWEARRARYLLLFSMYENTSYQNLHLWAQSYKTQYGLYDYIRAIYNPSYRLGEFWKIHLLGGALDPAAGDGKVVHSALPIETKNQAVRDSLAVLWKASNWQVKKDVLSLWGSTMGDAFVKVIDDPVKEKLNLKLIHPARMKFVEQDDYGNVKAYVIEYEVPDPRPRSGPKDKVLYTEQVTRDGEMVVFETFLNERPYDWGVGDVWWEEPYGFIPLVAIQHNNVGLPFGFSEIGPGLSSFREVDDLASKLSDQVRRAVDAPWLFAGVKASDITFDKPEDTDDNPQGGRENLEAIYASDPHAKAQAILAPLDIGQVAGYIKDILATIEENFPELNADLHNVTGDISGRALRINRAPAEEKVLQRRPNYDDAIVRAQKMALWIGNYRGYEGYTSFSTADPYLSGELDHTIGARPVFAQDPQDDIDLDTAFWTAANSAKAFGLTLPAYLKYRGWSDDKIKLITNDPEYKLKQEAAQALINAQQQGYTPPNANSNGTNQKPPTAQAK